MTLFDKFQFRLVVQRAVHIFPFLFMFITYNKMELPTPPPPLPELHYTAPPVKKFGVIGDTGFWNKRTEMIRDNMLKRGISHLVLPGDNLYEEASGYEDVWSHWSKYKFSFSVVALGNHVSTFGEEKRFFAIPAECYSRSFGNSVRFIVMNSENPLNVETQARWLDRELANSTEPVIYVVYHRPSRTVNGPIHGHTWRQQENFQNAIFSKILARRDKVTAVLVGHDHVASLVHIGNIPFLVSGATWSHSPGRWVDTMDEGISVKSAWVFRGGAHWLMLENSSDGSLDKRARFSFIRAKDNRVVCSGVLERGKKANLDSVCKKN